MKITNVSSISLVVSFLISAVPLQMDQAHAAKFSGDEQVTVIVNEYTEAFKKLDAFDAPLYGDDQALSSFGDALSPQALERPFLLYAKTLKELIAVSADSLSPDHRLTYDLLREDLEVKLQGQRFPEHYLSTHLRGGRLSEYLEQSSPSLAMFPFTKLEHYEAFLQRSHGFSAFVDRLIATLKEGAQKGYVLNCDIAQRTPNNYLAALESDVEKNPFFRPTQVFPTSIQAADQVRLTEEFRVMIRERILPNYQRFHQFFTREYQPLCRSEYGYGTLPDGAAWYTWAIEKQTDLKLTPEELHQVGLSEVQRIFGEIAQIANDLHFSGSVPEFLQWMKARPENYFGTKAELLNAFESVRARVTPGLSQLFLLTPKSDYRIVESENPNAAGASYWNPTDAVPYGRFVYNGANLKSTAIFDVTTLSMHEAIPGHHFHLALQYENKNLTEYQRKILSSTSFAEGWGLYAESLGNEIGMFTDPVQRFGHLNYELLRAVRIVVDTGIHAKGWTRAQVIAYMGSHLAKSPSYIDADADRYSVWPGQALAYKVGQLKIRALRTEAERALGTKFDVRKFHELVLGSGTVTLPILEKRVREWTLIQ